LRKRVPWLHILLFVVTFFTTLAAGAFQQNIDLTAEPGRIWEGLPFSLTLLAILLSHELSHYFTSRAHHTRATLPYFIPAPNIIGTFGAVIKMTSPIISRRALVDIGASGPVVGFVVSVVASSVGLAQSKFVFVGDATPLLGLGEPMIFSFLARVFVGVPPEGYDILLHPVAFAGWIGLFVTFLNLIPIGQLDGGHVAYALLGPRQELLSKALVVLLVLGSVLFWWPWAVWAVLMVFLGLKHPPIMRWETPLDPRRKFVGILAFIIFILTFMPRPFVF
jgi:membrane-associated protease RseP (regulator of RpoE activity)